MKLKVIQSTVFKQYAQDSTRLRPEDKVTVTAGEAYEIHSWKQVGRYHIKVALVEDFLGAPPRNTWYVFRPHVQLISSGGKPPELSPSPIVRPIFSGKLPADKNLNVPYKSQMDNVLNPKGSCNVTCFAMVMAYFQLQRRSSMGQLEDELYRYMTNNKLSRHEPQDLAKMAAAYKLKSNFTMRADLQDIRKAIAEGKPCIVHGYFTSFGHIIVIRGYDQKGFWVNDPFGEWTRHGYRKGVNGANLYYSNQLIQSKCSPEGKDYIWLHQLTRA